MNLIYDGFLKTQVAAWISFIAEDYNHAIEMSSLPKNWREWVEDNLVDYSTMEEDCQGQSYSRKTKMYATVNKGEKGEGLFVFFKTKKEKDAVVRDFPGLIVNKSPFKTAIK